MNTSNSDETDVDHVLPRGPARTSSDAAMIVASLEQAAWALAALARLGGTAISGTDRVRVTSEEDAAAARVLASVGLLTEDCEGFAPSTGLLELSASVPATARAAATTSVLRQIATVAGILPKAAEHGWAANDDATLLAQGRASAFGGQMLATFAVASLAGLTERFHNGGRFLDVGTGVGELGAAFADALPAASVVGLDVVPRAIELARAMIRDRGLEHRFEVRQQGVENLDETDRYDLAWIPAPFIPSALFSRALANIHRSLSPGGWIVVAAGRLEGDDLGVAVTRWQTVLACGTPLSAADAHTTLAAAGFTNAAQLPTPAGAPALYCGQRTPAPKPQSRPTSRTA